MSPEDRAAALAAMSPEDRAAAMSPAERAAFLAANLSKERAAELAAMAASTNASAQYNQAIQAGTNVPYQDIYDQLYHPEKPVHVLGLAGHLQQGHGVSSLPTGRSNQNIQWVVGHTQDQWLASHATTMR